MGVILLAGGVLPWCAQAQSSPYFVGVSQTFGSDDNLLRLGENDVAPDGYAKADTFSTSTLLAGFNQGIGRQRVFANLSLRDTRYSRNDIFNNQGYSLRSGLDWSTVERLSGALNFSASRNLQRFGSAEIGFLREKNLETVRSLSTRISLGLVTEYSLELSGGRTDVVNSLDQAGVQARNFTQDNASIGLRWNPSNYTSAGLSVGSTRGSYPKFRTTATGFQADRFKRDDVSLTAAYRLSGASSLDLRLSTGKTVYDLNEQRNFDGVTGQVAWTWQPSIKLVLISSLTRDTGQESYATAIFTLPAIADYSRDNTAARVSAEYSFSSKVGFTAAVLYYRNNVVRTVENPFIPLSADGREKVTQFTLGARWSPWRTTQIGCDLNTQDRRAEGALVVNLRGTQFSCFGQFTLQ